MESQQVIPPPDFPFTTDGCSGGMSAAYRFVFGKNPPWEGDCVEHDRVYHAGGSAADRLKADTVLRWRVTQRGYPRTAQWMFQLVRIGGHPLLPFPWRWGYGYYWPKTYRFWSSK